MDSKKESPLFIKTYDYTKWLLAHTQKFPKSQRFVMARRIEEAILDFHDCLLAAVKLPGGDGGTKGDGDEQISKLSAVVPTSRKELLAQASLELEKLKYYLRLSKDLSLLNLKQYEYSSVAVVEIGKLLGGWIKKV